MSTRRSFLQSILFLPPLLSANAFAQDNATAPKPRIFANFEDNSWGEWTTEGNAFGTSPATDALFPGKIRGFVGHGFVCTLDPRKGNAATGKAVSREFIIEKPVITFKIGGGNFPGQTCLNLVVDGKIERTETGEGTAQLLERSWDVSSLLGKTAHFEIVDNSQSDSRGYVMVDDIAFGERRVSKLQEILEREIHATLLEKNAPCIGGAISINGQIVAIHAEGVNSTATNVPFTIYTPVWVGSLSKPLSAYIIAKVVESGKLSYEDRFVDIRPDLVDKSANSVKDATLSQFINHTSGITGGFPLDGPHNEIRSGREFRESCARRQLASAPDGKPGEIYKYEGGMNCAALMAEKVTGKTFEELIAQYYTDAGLKTVQMGLSEKFVHGVDTPSGYIRDARTKMFLANSDKETTRKNWIYWKSSPGGSFTGNTIDMIRAFSLCMGYLPQNESGRDNPIYSNARTVPSSISPFTRGGWQKWREGGYFHAGSFGAEKANVQILDEKKAVLYLYSNCTLKGIGEEQDGNYPLGELIARMNEHILAQ